MAFKYEELTIWSIATLTKYFKGQDFGLPVEFKQQAKEKDFPTPGIIQILFNGPDFRNVGTKNERYGIIHVDVMVNTTYVPTDIYHHLRVKAKVTDALLQEIPLLRVGTKTYDGMIVGILRPLPGESLTISTISVEEPDESLVQGTYCIELC